MDRTEHKVMHINLYDDQVKDYKTVRHATGITNDNDLVRFLFRRMALQLAAPPIIDTRVPHVSAIEEIE